METIQQFYKELSLPYPECAHPRRILKDNDRKFHCHAEPRRNAMAFVLPKRENINLVEVKLYLFYFLTWSLALVVILYFSAISLTIFGW